MIRILARTQKGDFQPECFLPSSFIDMKDHEDRVKSGKCGRSAKFGQRLWLFHILITGIKNQLSKQTMKILMRRLIRSRLFWISSVCKCMSEFTWCPKLPDFTLPQSYNSLTSQNASLVISGKPKPKLTKRRLRQLNRTESTRFILDNKADVPLLPDLTRTRGPGKRGSLDTDDKETQTSVNK